MGCKSGVGFAWGGGLQEGVCGEGGDAVGVNRVYWGSGGVRGGFSRGSGMRWRKMGIDGEEPGVREGSGVRWGVGRERRGRDAVGLFWES